MERIEERIQGAGLRSPKDLLKIPPNWSTFKIQVEIQVEIKSNWKVAKNLT